tara:strand:- start:23 stop:349 length:327 start_codon:yes stop_codon:yes gene_type:complete
MRDKLYYPDNEITKNLYTFGNEFMLSNIEYKGFYHKYSTGEIYTLKEWNPLLSNKLLPFEDTSGLKFRYKQLKPNFKTKKFQSKTQENKNNIDLNDIIIPPDINNSAI